MSPLPSLFVAHTLHLHLFLVHPQGWGQKMFTFTDPALPITSIGAWKKQLLSAKGQLEVEMTVKATKSKMVPEK